VALTLAAAAPETAEAACTSLKSGAVVYDVTGCGALVPEKHFDLTKEKYAWIADLDAAGRKKFFVPPGFFICLSLVMSIAVIAPCAKFAYRRLYLEFTPPEQVKV
jgi:hypothetical protein